jgi:TfoX/Sxy family transcriptional regulator of competence genes
VKRESGGSKGPPRWKKAPASLVEAFAAAAPAYAGAARRSMFGYPALFLAGKMFAGLHEDRLVLRLDDDAAADAKARGAGDFSPMAGRVMKGWVAVPGSLLTDAASMRGWIDRAFETAGARPVAAKRRGPARKPAGRARR